MQIRFLINFFIFINLFFYSSEVFSQDKKQFMIGDYIDNNKNSFVFKTPSKENNKYYVAFYGLSKEPVTFKEAKNNCEELGYKLPSTSEFKAFSNALLDSINELGVNQKLEELNFYWTDTKFNNNDYYTMDLERSVKIISKNDKTYYICINYI